MSLQIVQISDTHLCHDVPQRLTDLENCVQAINKLEVPPNLVIHTGDVAENGTEKEYRSAQQLLDKLDAPYFVIPGNRDKRAQLRKVFCDKRYQLSARGWVQYSIEDYSVRLIMVDTVSEQSNKGALCNERLQHLEQMLSADTSKPIALFLHHPPYKAEGIPDPYQYENWNDVEKLGSLLARYNNICGMYCGHVHRFIDGSIAGTNASAITCLAGDLRKGDVSDAERLLPVYKKHWKHWGRTTVGT